MSVGASGTFSAVVVAAGMIVDVVAIVTGGIFCLLVCLFV